MPARPDYPPRSPQQRIGSAGYHHVLHPRITLHYFLFETENSFTQGRRDPSDKRLHFVKPIYSSYVDLLNLSGSDSSNSSISDPSENNPALLQGILREVNIEQVDCDNIQIEK